MPKYRFVLSISNIRRDLRRTFENVVSQQGITATQFQVLRRLWEGDGISAQTLAKEAYLDAATMTGVLDRLEAKKLLERHKHESDRRAVRIFLTEAGRALEEPLLGTLERLNDHALQGLNAEEREQLLDLLSRVQKNLDKQIGGIDNGNDLNVPDQA
jgi:DNA-binding MarR family transcriptional regulator